MIAKPVFVAGWKVAEDSPADVLTLGAYPDGFGDNQLTIGMDQDIGLIVQDAFVCRQRSGRQQARA